MRRRLLLLLAAPLCSAVHAGEEPDMHYRGFAIEPADRMEWGEGHVTAGFERETRPQRGVRSARNVPLEWTFGLPAGFVAVLGAEAQARTRHEEGGVSAAASREALLKYALPERDGFHLAVFAGVARQTDDGPHTHSRGLSANLDTRYGVFGAGVTSDRRRPNEQHGGREAGANWYRIFDNGWGLATELRHGRDAAGESVRHWLLGGMRVIGRSLLLDAGVGGNRGAQSGRRLNFGISWFY